MSNNSLIAFESFSVRCICFLQHWILYTWRWYLETKLNRVSSVLTHHIYDVRRKDQEKVTFHSNYFISICLSFLSILMSSSFFLSSFNFYFFPVISVLLICVLVSVTVVIFILYLLINFFVRFNKSLFWTTVYGDALFYYTER